MGIFLVQIISILYICNMIVNVMCIAPHIDKLTDYIKDNHSYTLPKKIRYYILFFGVIMYFFLGYIKRVRKEKHLNLEIERLKHFNTNGRNSQKIKAIERNMKLSKVKRKSKKLFKIK